jgi:hypothetical protein
MDHRAQFKVVLATATAIGVLVAAACSQEAERLAAPSPHSATTSLDKFEDFSALTASAVCTVAGGNPVTPLMLPTGYEQSIIASEPSYLDNGDMQTQNETGKDAGRFLYRTHENTTGAGVSVTDLVTGQTKVIAQRADWERFDGIVWTPWGTILASEEVGPAARRDPDFPDAVNGLVYEFFLDPQDPTTVDHVVARPAIGSKSHEGMRFDPEGNLYGISETNPGYIYRFVPDRRDDLSSGQSYALKVTSPNGDRVGEAEWVPLDRDAVKIDAVAAATAAGATGYNRPEDVEMGTSSGNNKAGNRVLYVALTGPSAPADNRVLGIDLREPEGGSDHATAFVYNYVAWDVNVTHEFEMPDNLALDRHGNLFITEDPGGNFRNGTGKIKGDDIWMAEPPKGGEHQASPRVSRFASINDCDAEPTGIYFEMGGDRLFVNIQHRGGDGADKTVAIERAK